MGEGPVRSCSPPLLLTFRPSPPSPFSFLRFCPVHEQFYSYKNERQYSCKMSKIAHAPRLCLLI
jgi:hypothetical protein